MEYIVSGCILRRCANFVFDGVAANKQTNLNRILYFFSTYVFILMRLILDLFSAIASALWTGMMGMRGEIDNMWKRPWPVLR